MDLELSEIIDLLLKKLSMQAQDRLIIIAKDDDQASTALEHGTIALVPEATLIEASNCIIYLADPEGDQI